MAEAPQTAPRAGGERDLGVHGGRDNRRGCARLTLRTALLLALALVAAYAAAWVYRLLLATIGEYATPGAVGVVALLAAIALPLLLVAYGSWLAAAVHRALVWLGGSAPVRALERRFPQAAAFVAGRFARHRAAGLGLTVAVVVAAALLAFLVELAAQAATGSSLALVDLRVVNLFAALREPGLDRAMIVIAWLGSVPVVAVVAVVTAALALRMGRREDAALVALALLAGALFAATLDTLTAPPPATAAPVASGWLLALGGTALSAACYGTVAYTALRTLPHGWPRNLLAVALSLLIFSVGVARVYLGLEYLSAVIAGWTAGLLWVVLVVIVERLWPRAAHLATPRRARERRAGAVIASVAPLVLAAVALLVAYAAIPPLPVASAARPVIIAPARVPAFAEDALPHYTVTLFGARQEPITIILVGTRAQVEAAFRAAGWTEAERLSVGSLAHGIVSALDGHPDPAGPVTPSFVGVQPEALAFSQEVGGSFARRHHIRIWRTNVVTSTGQPVWLGEASYDQGFELSPRTLFPTHHIGPDIDAERAYDVQSLRSTGDVARSQLIQLVPPERGHNAAGDPFFTGGQAAVVWLA